MGHTWRERSPRKFPGANVLPSLRPRFPVRAPSRTRAYSCHIYCVNVIVVLLSPLYPLAKRVSKACQRAILRALVIRSCVSLISYFPALFLRYHSFLSLCFRHQSSFLSLYSFARLISLTSLFLLCVRALTHFRLSDISISFCVCGSALPPPPSPPLDSDIHIDRRRQLIVQRRIGEPLSYNSYLQIPKVHARSPVCLFSEVSSCVQH